MHWTPARLCSVSLLSVFLLAPLASAQFTPRWSSPETTPLAGADDSVTSVAPTGEGRLLLAVHSESGTNQATRIHCRDADGALLWELDPLPAGVLFDQAHSRRGGGAFFCGMWSSPTGSAPPRLVATRIDDSGTQLWTSQWTPPNFEPSVDLVQSTLDEFGALWLVGTLNSGQRIFLRRLSPLGVLLAHTELNAWAPTSLRAACAFPGGVAMAGKQGEQPIVRVFDVFGHELWTHGIGGFTPGSDSAFSDVVCNPDTNRLYLCGTVDEGLPTQSGILAEYQLSGEMVKQVHVGSIYGPGRPSSLERLVLRSDDRLHAVGRIQFYAPQWFLLRLELTPAGGVGYGVEFFGTPTESLVRGTQVLAGPLNQLWVLTPWGAHGDALPTHWILQENDTFHREFARFDAFPPAPSGGAANFVGLERVDEGLAIWGALGPQADGTTDGHALVVDTSALPTGYCTVEPTPFGCEPFLSYTGRLWDSQRPLHLLAGNLNNHSSALALYSTTGPNAVPFLGGTLCVAPPLRRSAVKPTGGSTQVGIDCTGTFDVILDTLLGPDPFAHVPGNEIFLQVWSRDAGDGRGRGTPAMRITVP